MIDVLGVSVPLTQITGSAVLTLMALLAITDKIWWHTRGERETKRADKWEDVALRALGAAEKLTVQAEVTNEIISRLPDPLAEERERS